MTVQACISGEGKLLPPFIVFTGKHLMHAYTNGGPLGTRFTVSKNGWMDTNGFVEWMKKIFIPSLPDERPVILIIDGHLSHVSYEVRQLARENNVTMLKLPSHLTHILQPLDVSVFKGMKAAWDTEVSTYTRLNRKSVTKKDFASILGNVWKKYDPQSGVNGFRKTGIIPLDKNAIEKDAQRYSEPYTSTTDSLPTGNMTPTTVTSTQALTDASTCSTCTQSTATSIPLSLAASSAHLQLAVATSVPLTATTSTPLTATSVPLTAN